MQLILPWPPSMNRYWRAVSHLRGRVLISAEGRRYRQAVAQHLLTFRLPPFAASDRLAVKISAYPPDQRKRDLDNLLKPLLDALEAAGIMPDDSQIDSLCIVRQQAAAPGRVVLTLETIA